MSRVDLTQLREGESGIVAKIDGGFGLTKRLQTLGLRTGKKVTKISSQLMRGPITVRIGNSQIAIGFGMAKKIILRQAKTK